MPLKRFGACESLRFMPVLARCDTALMLPNDCTLNAREVGKAVWRGLVDMVPVSADVLRENV